MEQVGAAPDRGQQAQECLLDARTASDLGNGLMNDGIKAEFGAVLGRESLDGMGIRRKKGMIENQDDGQVGLAYGEISRETALQAN